MIRGLLVALLLVAGALLAVLAGTPLHLGYDDSAGVPPEIGSGNGYVAVRATEIAQDDIVVYWTDDGQYLARTVVEARETTVVVTQPSSGPSGDTLREEIPRWRVSAKVLFLGGSPVIVPGLAAAAPLLRAAQSALPAAVALLVVALGLAARNASRRNTQDAHQSVRPRLSLELFLRIALVLGIVATAAVTAVGAATYDVTYATPEDGQQTQTVTVTADAPVVPSQYLHYVVESEGATVVRTTETVSGVVVTAAVSSDWTAAVTRGSVTVVPYLAVLPRDVLVPLHRVHPAVAVGVTILALFGPLVVLYRVVRGGERLLRRLLVRARGSSRRSRPARDRTSSRDRASRSRTPRGRTSRDRTSRDRTSRDRTHSRNRGRDPPDRSRSRRERERARGEREW